MVYKLKVTKTYYTVRRGAKTYKYVKLIVNLPLDEKLLNVDYVYVLTPDEYEVLLRGALSRENSSKISEIRAETCENTDSLCEKLLVLMRNLFAGKKYVKLENVLKTLSESGISVTREDLEKCGIEIVNKGREKGYYVRIPT